MRSDSVEVKVGQVWRSGTRTLRVIELTGRTFYGREGVPSARVHCTETGRRTVIAVKRFRGMQFVSEAPAGFALESRK